MSLHEEKPTFFDRNTIIAFAIIMGVWFVWSKYVESRYPQQSVQAKSPTKGVTDGTNIATGQSTNQHLNNDPANEQVVSAPEDSKLPNLTVPVATEELISFEDDQWSFQISSLGMGLKAINIKSFQTRDDKPITLGSVEQDYPFTTRLALQNQPDFVVPFVIERLDANTFLGRATVAGISIEKRMVIDSAKYAITTSVKMSGVDRNFKSISTILKDSLLEGDGGSVFAPSYDFSSWLIRHEGTKTRQMVLKSEGASLESNNVSIASLSAHYFALAVVDRSGILPKFKSEIQPGSAEARGELIYLPPSNANEISLDYIAFAGPKAFDTLASIDGKLTDVIDFGIFAVVAKPILQLLRFIYSLVHNWGWSIIILTIIVRLLVLPFNFYSYKSMKVMQKIQPEMNRIRDSFKDKKSVEDRARLNQEIMELMRRNKANPLGGCLPMLLQLPVFIALYQVLGQSLELYRAPFILWIHDLSLKDPFFVLPVLMGVAMFVQQKITPTTMDPVQAKILLWMPVIFSVFMIGLPSGLTLYIFVSTVFGVIQQYIFMRDRSAIQVAKEAKA